MVWYMIWYDMIWYDIWYGMIMVWYDMIYDILWYMLWYDVIWYILLNVIGLTPGGSSTVHIYTQTIHKTTQWNRIPRTELI